MRLLDLIEQNYGVRFAAHRFGELAALLITHISRRRSNQTADAEFFHILRHIDAHDILFIVEQRLCERLGKLRLTNARRPEEQKRSDRAPLILDAGA